jgi:hypothetical protein
MGNNPIKIIDKDGGFGGDADDEAGVGGELLKSTTERAVRPFADFTTS